MLDFHPLALEELPRLRQFFGYNSGRICDTTPGTAFIWRGYVQDGVGGI